MAAIDRGPWTGLIDDDGSNLVGTVWNKDKIKTVLLDPIDAAIVAPPVTVPIVAGDFTANNGSTWSGITGTVKYALIGTHWLYVSAAINGTIGSPAPSELHMKIPAGKVAAVTSYGVAKYSHAAASWENLLVEVPATSATIKITRSAYAAFGIGASGGGFAVLLLV